MIIVGECINGTIESVREAILAHDSDFISRLAKEQSEAGASYIDVNAGTDPQREPEDISWMVETVQAVTETPVCVDSANLAALEAGLKASRGPALLNSTSAEEARREPLLSLAKRYGARVIALTLDDSGLPKTPDQRIGIAQRLAESAAAAGIPLDDLFIDPLVRAVAVENEQGTAFLDAVAGIRQALPAVHVICGLSNISFQMPERRLLNRTFLAMAMARGLDAAILDPLDRGLQTTIRAAEALLGRDEMCLEYIRAYRAGLL